MTRSVGLLLGLLAPVAAWAVSLNAEQIYGQALRLRDVWWERGEAGIHLKRGIVVQNDSPGCGERSDSPGVFEEVSGSKVLRKELEITGPVPRLAQVAFIAKELRRHTAELELVVNGNVIVRKPTLSWAPDAKQYEGPVELAGSEGWAWSRWQYQSIPGEYLHQGRNRILIRSRDGRPGWTLMVADYADFHKGCASPVFPEASAKSEDGGKSWRHDNLGSGGRISGEYVIRVLLGGYRPNGQLSSEVIDLAQENAGFKTVRSVSDVRIRTEAQVPPGTKLGLEVRSGDMPTRDAPGWSAWYRPGPDGGIAGIRGRYLQWRIDLSTTDPEASPELRRIDVEARVANRSTGAVSVVREDNFELRAAPEGYTYEDYRSEYLRRFRQQFHLDAVVAGAHTEWERQRRLLKWAYRLPLVPWSQRPFFPWDPRKWIDTTHLPGSTGSTGSRDSGTRPVCFRM